MRWLLFLLLTVPAMAQLQAGIISANRSVDWSNVGITPATRNTVCASLTSSATSSNINSAIAGCAANQVVSLASGTYTLTAGIDFANHSNVTVRGAGAGATILNFTGNVNCFGLSADVCIRNNDNSSAGSPQHTANWTAGYAVGTTAITLSSTTGLVAGANLVLDQLNDSDTDNGQDWVCETMGVCSSEGPSGAERSGRAQSQIVTVVSVVGSTVNITPGLYMPNWSAGQSPGAWWSNSTITGSGIENVTLDHTSGGATSGVLMFNARNCWVKGVRSIDAARNHVWFFQSRANTVQDSYFYQSQNHTTQSYGVEPYLSSDNLVQNNIFQQVAAPITVNGSASGSVFGYNFSINDLSGFAPAMSGSAWLHSAGVDNLLFEGNVGAGFFGDNIHGTHNFVTLLRNYFQGWETGSASQTWATLISPYGRYFNVLGNVLGHSGYHNTYQGSSATSVYNLGNTINGIGPDSLVASTSYRFGNYDVVTAAVRWCGNSSDTGWSTTCSSTSEVPTGISPYPNTVPASESFPPSFYLAAKPAWFGSQAYPPIGPDVTGGPGPGGFAKFVPAQNCYINTMSGPTDGTGSVLSFDANTCYGATSSVVVQRRR